MEEAQPSTCTSKAAPSKKKKRKPKKKYQAESNNDPNPPSAYQRDYAPDEHSWTPHQETINMRNFKGKQPREPTFNKKSTSIKYFLKFFPLLLMSSIVKWTNQKLKAR